MRNKVVGRDLTSAAIYRVRQFLAAVTAGQPSQADQAFVARFLAPAQRRLFQRMSRNDQQHAIAVARTLIDNGWTNDELIQAALLHDVGKTESDLHLGYRVAIVLLRAIWPAALDWLGAVDAGWRRPFHIHQHHPEIGAKLAAEAGASPRVVELILRHQAPSGAHATSRELMALQVADANH